MSGVDETFGEKADVESVLSRAHIHRFFFRSEQVEEQRGETGRVQGSRHELIARAVPAASAPVHEEDEDGGAVRESQGTLEGGSSGWNLNVGIHLGVR